MQIACEAPGRQRWDQDLCAMAAPSKSVNIQEAHKIRDSHISIYIYIYIIIYMYIYIYIDMISLILSSIYMDVLRVYIFVYIIPSADGALPRPWAENKVTWCMRKLQQLMSLQDWRRNMDIAGRCDAPICSHEKQNRWIFKPRTYARGVWYLYHPIPILLIYIKRIKGNLSSLTFRKGRT